MPSIPITTAPGTAIKNGGPAPVVPVVTPPPAAAAPAVAPKSAPAVVKMPTVDENYDAGQFFKPKAAATPAVEPKPVPAAVVTPEPATDKGSLAATLLKGKTPPIDAPAVTPPAAAAPTEDHPETKIQLDTKASPAAKDAFANLKTITGAVRQENATLKSKITELETKLKAAPVAGVPSEEFERLKAENKQFSDRLLVLDLQSHPSFKNQFTIPKQQQIDAAKELLVMNDRGDVDAGKLLALPRNEFGKAVSEIAGKLPAFDAAEFSASMRDAYKLQQNEQAAAAKAGDTLKAIQQGNQSKSTQAFEKVWNDTAAKATEFSAKWELPEGATAEQAQKINAYNESLSQISARAREFAFSPQSEEHVAANAIKAAAYDHHVGQLLPALLGDHERISRELHKATQELAAIRSRNPNRENLAHSGGVEPGSKKLEEMDHKAAADAVWGRRV